MKQVLRFGRRRASWELQDPRSIADVEFRRPDGSWDLEPSAYEIEGDDAVALRSRAVRVYAEHAASFLRAPPKGVVPVDVNDLRPVKVTEGTASFAYASACHREVLLGSVSDLLGLVTQIKEEAGQRIVGEVTSPEVLDYAGRRLVSEDPEWRAATAPGQRAQEWPALIEKRRRRAAR